MKSQYFQIENALFAAGFEAGLPYWDWTLPMDDLPDSVRDAEYLNPITKASSINPLYSGQIKLGDTVITTSRSPDAELYVDPQLGSFTPLADQVN